ncbi:antirepressor [Aggregatibacter actinomycetemcomitans]|uniref:Antirepressor n=1 Tax=Aggregatibacter actinomycetemcomitans TaxID=714 RepID=A0A5D0EJ89_AGGAC|nr:phage repressor protein/antirepressor Ant [Aggregatibacter actinomycetemcomitans]NP_852746.1 anti-repressor Ant [Haemophilus phage Aaphi23]AMQ94619.1 antirepressor [Aggregatibacter actinomycetemcomitans]MCE3057958.1 phage repressor protein/antirepressor Ant [Aggregatibacter actinomycetemcomitans]TYA21709.1 phage repressor protein/antirepressor Ant [Aggregatibacter actinomycetemcomitans]TYA34443.1 phage repressor protein/antirepressor Ant [Aggregatibacter actinomycetemcomitans]TYA39495.1 ph
MSNQSQLSTYNFESHTIRTLAINNEPWFIAKDVCDAIGIDNNRKALLALDEDEKGVTLSNTLGGKQEMNIISESGMYTLILRCRDAVKKGSVPHRFRKWVTAEVLPAIRKTGKYEAKTTVDDRTGLRNAVNMLVSKKGLIYSEAYHLIHQRFNVESIEDLTLEQLPQAVEYVHKIILEGELITDVALPEPKPKTYTIEMTENDITVLLWLWFISVRVIGSLKMLVKPLKLLQAPIAPEVVSQANEYPFTVEHARRILLKMSKDLEADPWRDDNLSRVLPKIRNFNESDLAYPGNRHEI